MAFWKIVGFVVTPTTFFSAISDARLPLRRRSRLRSSSQIETPAPDSVSRFLFVIVLLLFPSRSSLDGGQRFPRRGLDRVGGEPELAEQRLEVRRRPARV